VGTEARCDLFIATASLRKVLGESLLSRRFTESQSMVAESSNNISKLDSLLAILMYLNVLL